MNEYHYWLPGNAGRRDNYETATNSLVIVGANGSGKSKLGAWIEQQDFEKVHRIVAQRSLNFSENIPLKSYAEAQSMVLYGSTDEAYKMGKEFRWEWGAKYTTKLLDDFNDVLAALIAQENNDNKAYVDECREAEREGLEKPRTRKTSLGKMTEVWDAIFPQRQLRMHDASFIAIWRDEETGCEKCYSASEMSDGERTVLYLASQVLCVPRDKILIIDEPELHLHPSLMNQLWLALERVRKDCLFVYITHDVHFASLHGGAKKVWVKGFDGTNWEWQFVEHADMPEPLMLELLGNRKNVLFVEGNAGSYDVQLYSALYPNYYVVPCGGCEQVKSHTKSFRHASCLHECSVYGIVDRDFRSDHEVARLESEGVYCLGVSEVEILFAVEPLLRFIAHHLGRAPDDAIRQVKQYVMSDRFASQIDGQICKAVVFQLKRALAGIEIAGKNEESLRIDLDKKLSGIAFDDVVSKQVKRFNDARISDDYDQVLRVFNEKGVASSIGHYFGIDNKEYCQMVINLANSDCRQQIAAVLKPYIPELPDALKED